MLLAWYASDVLIYDPYDNFDRCEQWNRKGSTRGRERYNLVEMIQTGRNVSDGGPITQYDRKSLTRFIDQLCSVTD